MTEEETNNILEQYRIPVEGFYNYYSVPWDENLYVKFPTNRLVMEQNGTRIGFGSSFEDTDDGFGKKLSKFMTEHYLGSARETDVHRLQYIIGDRVELKT